MSALTADPALADLPDAVQWSEGMLLSPQHLQQSEAYWHAQLRARLASRGDDYWGLLTLEMDSKAWGEGVVTLTRVEAVLPDGLPVAYPQDKESRSLTLDLNKKGLPPDQRRLGVWLGLPRRGFDSARQDGTLQRYLSYAGEMAVDENTGTNPTPVARLRPALTLLRDDDDLARYTAIKLMEVYRDVDNHIKFTDYHPALLRLGASAFLGERSLARRLPDLARRIWAKLRELSPQAETGEAEGAEMEFAPEPEAGSEGQRHLEMARILAAALPVFDVDATGPDARLPAAYRALAQLAGRCAGLGGQPMPPRLEPYRHDDCHPGFELALRFMDKQLNRVNTDMERLAFARVGENGFSRTLAGKEEARDFIIELKPRPGQSPEDLAAWLQAARIASDECLAALRQRRIPGARTAALSLDEKKALRLPVSAQLFRVSNQAIELDVGLRPVFQKDRAVVIQGSEDKGRPAGILLYHWKRGRPEAVPEAGHA